MSCGFIRFGCRSASDKAGLVVWRQKGEVLAHERPVIGMVFHVGIDKSAWSWGEIRFEEVEDLREVVGGEDRVLRARSSPC
jgi:hypothetical protein